VAEVAFRSRQWGAASRQFDGPEPPRIDGHAVSGSEAVGESSTYDHVFHASSALAPGTRLGPYEVLTLLGTGGMGEVYRAKDTKLGRDVAVKILRSDTGAPVAPTGCHGVRWWAALKGRSPDASSCSMTPSENMSERSSTDRPSACSGDM